MLLRLKLISGNMERRGGIIQNKSQFNFVRKKENSKRKINMHKAEQRSFTIIRALSSAEAPARYRSKNSN